MDRLCPALYRSYGTYTNTKKMIPLMVDGLIPVQRRVLMACHTIARSSYIPTAKILAEATGRWHPHNLGESPLENLIHNEFADGDGQWGTRLGVDAISCAAMRYTKAKSNKDIEIMAFKYINYVEWKEDELDPEPVALPTMIPFCLMGKYELNMIAFGFKTEIPVYKRKDLVNRLLFLLGQKRKKTIIPNIRGCDVISGEFDRLLCDGKGKIEVKGKVSIDEQRNEVHIHGWSPRQTFQAILNKIDKYKGYKLLSNGDIGFIDQTGNGDLLSKIVFSVVRQRNVAQIFNKMKEAIDEALTSTLSYNIYTVDFSAQVKLTSVDNMLLAAYEFYKKTYEQYVKDSINGFQTQLLEYQVITKIRPHIQKTLKQVDTVSLSAAITELATKVKASEDSIKMVIDKYKIRKLMTINLDLQEIHDKITSLTDDLKHIDSRCLNHYGEL